MNQFFHSFMISSYASLIQNYSTPFDPSTHSICDALNLTDFMFQTCTM